jgi:ArsR family transcriptional regulator, arsenate/arsenite/antimonite-responsive transcriptional repressor
MDSLVTIGNKATRSSRKLEDLSVVFKALSDPNRLRILTLLKQSGCCTVATNPNDKGLCACDIESQVDLSQPTISHHMRILRQAGLVDAQKVGPWMWYRRNEDLLKQVGEVLSKQL